MKGMNDGIRAVVRAEVQARGITQAQLAELIDMGQPNLARLLAGRVGTVPRSWQKVLDALGLELVAVPKQEG